MRPIGILLQGYVFSILTGCTTEESTYCVQVAEEAECPSVEEINETIFPVDDCAGVHQSATEFSTRNDSVSTWIEDTATDAEFDACCFQTSYKPYLGGPECVDGRPVYQENGYLIATTGATASDWNNAGFPQKEVHTCAGEYWKRAALHEHSSIAAFQLLAIELLHFGAPASLVSRAQKAAQDELEHARAAFSIASSLLKEPQHPQEFPLPQLEQRSLQDFALSVLIEGAINESLAVVLAAHQRKHAQIPKIQEA